LELSFKRRLVDSLCRECGIGKGLSEHLVILFGYGKAVRVSSLSPVECKRILMYIERCIFFLKMSTCLSVVFSNIQRFIKNKSLRGLRHRYCLPVNGQRTHSNSNTQAKLGKLRKKKGVAGLSIRRAHSLSNKRNRVRLRLKRDVKHRRAQNKR
jgi:ribosomal protein S13